MVFSESPLGRALPDPVSPAEYLLHGDDDERAALGRSRREEPPETDRRFGGGREVQSPPAVWTARKPGQQGKGKRGQGKDNPPKRGWPQYRFQQRQQRKGYRAGGPG